MAAEPNSLHDRDMEELTAAARVLPRIEGNPWVIPGFRPGRHLADLNHY